MSMKVKLALRLSVYIAGLFLLALGVAFAVSSDLGVSPVNVLPYTLSCLTAKDQGSLTTACFCIFILLQILVLRRDYHPVQLLQILCAAMFGVFVNCANALAAGLRPANYLMQVLFAIVAVFMIAFGMFLYLCADLIPQPVEGFCLAVEQRFQIPYSRTKLATDCVLVVASGVIGLLGTAQLLGIREGTLLTMLSVGPLVGVFRRSTLQKRLCAVLGT